MGIPKPRIAEEITSLRELIEDWRAHRTKREPMPIALWEEATRLARIHGTYPIAKILNLNYAKLYALCDETPSKSTTMRTQTCPKVSPNPAQQSTAVAQPGFVDIGPPPMGMGEMPKEGPAAMAVELIRPDGTRLKIQHSGGPSFDIKALVGTFLEAK